ncbi:MAG: hypothetical protein KDK33_16600 [Leptospiraceae bacterium]|nr:hypothetical protein [Leptospiraceae bacterium]
MKYFLSLFLLIGFLFAGSISALPAFEQPLDRAEKSALVLHVRILSEQTEPLNSVASAVRLEIQLIDVLRNKAGYNARSIRVLHFLVQPNSFESGMRTPPGPGEWIIFLNIENVRMDGTVVPVPVLYRPAPFAFFRFDGSVAEDIRKLP